MAKNGHVRESGNVERTKLFSVHSYDLKSMSFKFGNDIFITFEMPRPIGKINISLLFRPSVIRGPCLRSLINGYTRLLFSSEKSSLPAN